MKNTGWRKQTLEEVKQKQDAKRKKKLKALSEGKKRPKVKSKPVKGKLTPRQRKMRAKAKLCERYDLPNIPCNRWGINKTFTDYDLLRGMLWTVFSKYIRERDIELPCITCNEIVEEKHAGHYLPVGGNSIELCFDETNVNGECPTCNADFNGWHLVPMRKNMVKKYGEEHVQALDTKAGLMRTVKWENEYIVEQIEKYKI